MILYKYKETETAIHAAKKAGEEVLRFYNSNFKSYKKEDDSVLTDADIASEKAIVSEIEKYNYGILSEETVDDLSRLQEKRVWIIDPLDGTRDFINKTGDFSIMIALVENNFPILGVVYKPTEDKLYFAEKDNGSYLLEKDNKIQKLSVSEKKSIEEAVFIFSRSHLAEEERQFIEKNNIKNIIQCGSVGLKIGLIAEKKVDCYISFSDKTSQWDTCAPEIILEEAGGKMTDLNGERFVYNREELKNLNGILATNNTLHEDVVKLIK